MPNTLITVIKNCHKKCSYEIKLYVALTVEKLNKQTEASDNKTNRTKTIFPQSMISGE